MSDVPHRCWWTCRLFCWLGLHRHPAPGEACVCCDAADGSWDFHDHSGGTAW